MNIITLPLLLVITGALFTSVGQILFKKAAIGFQSFSISRWIFNPLVLAGCGLHILGFLLYFFAFRHGELSSLYPATAICYPFTVYLGVKTLKEAFDKEKIVALLLILIGIVVITL